MPDFEKLIKKARNSPNNLDFDDACALAESAGFVERKRTSGSSHRIYKHPEVRELLNLQEYNGKAKPYQVRQLLSLIEDLGMEE